MRRQYRQGVVGRLPRAGEVVLADRDGPDQLQSGFNSFQLSVDSSALREDSGVTHGGGSGLKYQDADHREHRLTLSVVTVGEGRGNQRTLWSKNKLSDGTKY